MENQEIIDQNLYNSNHQITLPNSVGVLVLGICSIALCSCNIIGVALGIIALVLASKANSLYKENPQSYTIASFKNMNAGRICAIIGTVVSGLYFVFWIIYIIFFATVFTALPWQMYNY
ncbi:MAG: hypothetical protein K9J13_08405 [Saprospiraceae bacterium]|nr:hypothetical protein [Saprospiraceae bacterium]